MRGIEESGWGGGEGGKQRDAFQILGVGNCYWYHMPG